MMRSHNYSWITAEEPEEHYPSGGSLTQQLELMRANSEPELDMETARPRFTTIDDLIELARKLVDGLNRLGSIRHPLGVRRGVRSVVERNDKGEMLKAAGKTYFFDIRETREGKPYLVITESRLRGEGEKPERSSVLVFQENLQEFADLVTKMATRIGQGS